MSTASKAREKARKRALDAQDPERKNIRNLIRRGKIPRWSFIGRQEVSKLQMPAWKKRMVNKRFGLSRIVGSVGLIFDTKKSVDKQGSK